ncbi:hypothetical protein [Cohnella sp. GCM10012308]|uniref:hypothetical protein n=1 Tax=Cohnella sp. GCM10012308 TaxID=3317329 RepID=UPI00361F5D7F
MESLRPAVPHPLRRRAFVAVALVWAVLLISAFVQAERSSDMTDERPATGDYAVVAKAGDLAIEAGELKLWMRLKRSEVIGAYRKSDGELVLPDDWNKSFNGRTPLEALKKEALSGAIRAKAKQTLAKRFGIDSDYGYRKLSAMLTAENRRRNEAKSRGEAVYGPLQFEETTYYEYLLSNLDLKLKQALGGLTEPDYASRIDEAANELQLSLVVDRDVYDALTAP